MPAAPLVFRPVRAFMDWAALRHNHALARSRAGRAKLWCVLKANAYGHGLFRAAHALAGVADGFALVEIERAIALRAAGFLQPVLLLEGCYSADEMALCAAHRLIPVVHNTRQLAWLQAARLPQPLPIYLKLNTGMNRLGLDAEELPAALAALAALGYRANDIHLMTHFADADEPRGIGAQLARFEKMTAVLAHPLTHPFSLANSAALLRFPESVAGEDNWARPGIMLYGGSPFPNLHSAEDLGLQPVMTLTSELIAVRDLLAGECVGYGGAFCAANAMRVGVVACGYADGYPRHAPTGTPVLVAGQRTRTLGRVSMDKLCVDLAGINAAPGAPVTLWGRGLPADEVAAAAGTVSYELFCALNERVPVVDLDGE